MPLKIRRAAVLGAGVMGAQIAALLAAAGVRTYLLDLATTTPPSDLKAAAKLGGPVRNMRALTALETLKSLKPSPLYNEVALANVIPGNFDDDLPVLADCDWVIEAVVERLDIKKELLRRVSEVLRPGAPLTSNTSGISLEAMAADLPEHTAKAFFGTHFFNPPRYMYLVEVIPAPASDPALVNALSQWISERLGKGIVNAYDTVNFIGNRIGVLNLQATMKHMGDLGLNIETADALTGKLMGRPASATFRTADVVGLDTFAHVAKSVYDRATSDPFRDYFKMPAWIERLIGEAHLGQKTNNIGCYKKTKDAAGNTVILAYRPATNTYEPQQVQDFPWVKDASRESDIFKRLACILEQNDQGATFIWRVLRDTFLYSLIHAEEISGGLVRPIDQAISWGFNWERGPFELWQGLGYDKVLARMQKDGVALPKWLKPGLEFYRPVPGSSAWYLSGPNEELNLGTLKSVKIAKPPFAFHLPKSRSLEDKRVIAANDSASLVDIGDGVCCLVFHSKMNTIDTGIIEMTQKAVATVDRGYEALVIGNEGENFSAGANLKYLLELITKQDFKGIDRMLRDFQGTMQMLKFAPFPTVSCPHGLTLGGGCEVSLQTSRSLLAGETYAGLVEVGVGLIPAGGGTKELALRAYDLMKMAERGDPLPFLQHAFLLIGMARTSNSGFEAIDMGLYPATAAVTISRDYQVARAKAMALGMVRQGYAPPTPRQAVKVAGDPGIQTFRMMLYNMVEGRSISAYDAHVGTKVATVLCGGEVDGGSSVNEQFFLDLERRVFIELCHEAKTVARIEAMLKTGKPLRN